MQLQRLVQTYLLPSRWHGLDVLPKNVNGKIDRRGLRELFEQDADAADEPAARAEAH